MATKTHHIRAGGGFLQMTVYFYCEKTKRNGALKLSDRTHAETNRLDFGLE